MTNEFMDSDALKRGISDAVYNRLRDWGYLKLLPQEKVRITQKCFATFYKRIGKKGLIQKIRGWDCALGQILDIDNPQMFRVIPYMLTAYMYNFGEDFGLRGERGKNTRFVKRYTQPLVSSLQCDYRDPKFFGCEVLASEQEKIPGIGKLLAGKLDVNSTKERDQLHLLANNFVFPPTIRMRLSDGDYIIPDTPKDIGDFEARCQSFSTTDNSDAVWRIDTCLTGEEDREYLSDCFRWIFLTWYSIWHSVADTYGKNDLAHKLDPLACNSLMWEALFPDERELPGAFPADVVDAEFLRAYKSHEREYKAGAIWLVVDD